MTDNSGMQKWSHPGDGSKINSELDDYLVDRWGNKDYGKHWYELRVQVSSSNPTLHFSLEELYRALSPLFPDGLMGKAELFAVHRKGDTQ